LNQVLENANQIFSKLKLEITERDTIFLVLVALTYASVYYMPSSVGILIDLAIAYYCFRSKHPLILLLLFIIVNSRMNGMLDINKLPRISAAGNSISLLDFLMVSMWLKVIQKSWVIYRSTFGKLIFVVYLVLMASVMINGLISDIDLKLAIKFIRYFSYYVCYFYVFLAFRDFSDFNFVIKVLFFISCVVLLNQISVVMFDRGLDSLLFGQTSDYNSKNLAFAVSSGGYMSDKSRGDVGDAADPLLLFLLCLSLFGICKDKKMNNLMQLSIIMIIMIELILAARAYFIFILLPALAYARNIRNLVHMSKTVVILIILMLVIFIFIGGFGYAYFHDILLRLSGIYKFLNANTRAEVETGVNRINEAQNMISVIVKSPIIGFGFSSESKAQNTDLGFLNTMIIMGMIGVFVYLFLIIKFLQKCLSITRRISHSNPFRLSIRVFLFSMISLLIGYITTQDFFSSNPQNIAFMAMYLGLSELIFAEAIKYERLQIRDKP
jgi:hypothetical protein